MWVKDKKIGPGVFYKKDKKTGELVKEEGVWGPQGLLKGNEDDDSEDNDRKMKVRL
jgi:hypothetical protein